MATATNDAGEIGRGEQITAQPFVLMHSDAYADTNHFHILARYAAFCCRTVFEPRICVVGTVSNLNSANVVCWLLVASTEPCSWGNP